MKLPKGCRELTAAEAAPFLACLEDVASYQDQRADMERQVRFEVTDFRNSLTAYERERLRGLIGVGMSPADAARVIRDARGRSTNHLPGGDVA